MGSGQATGYATSKSDYNLGNSKPSINYNLQDINLERLKIMITEQTEEAKGQHPGKVRNLYM